MSNNPGRDDCILGLDPIHGTFLVGDVRSIFSWDSSLTSPFISKQASTSGYVFLCRLSWICSGTRNCCLFVATCFSRETWLGYGENRAVPRCYLIYLPPPNASFSVRNSAGFGGFIFWHSSESVRVILSTRITRLSWLNLVAFELWWCLFAWDVCRICVHQLPDLC